MPKILPSQITLLILSGGKSKRMSGTDKGLMDFNGKPMIQHSIDILTKQFSNILISANQHVDNYRQFKFPVITDKEDNLGPLGGIQAAINQTKTDYLLITPCDTPLVTRAISERLIDAATESDKTLFIAHDGQQLQNLHAFLNLKSGKLLHSINNYLKTDRKVQIWYEQNDYVIVDCTDLANDFKNINSPEDLNNARPIANSFVHQS